MTNSKFLPTGKSLGQGAVKDNHGKRYILQLSVSPDIIVIMKF